MASLGVTCRLSARITSRQLRHHVSSRGFSAATANLAAQNFTMPALSPTMTEGNIASWKVKEGDHFTAGDVLLEIETDKAQMDVEAQDDGVMAKIMMGDGEKSIKVGQRIAVIAEEGDDLSNLQIPEEAPSSAGQPGGQDRPAPQAELAGGVDRTESSPSQAEAPSSSKPDADAAADGAANTAKADKGASGISGKARKQTYPLYPSVMYALRQNGLTKEDADKIPATGPQGRLLKGDVLAFVGKLSEKNLAADLSKRLEKMGHLDLSNIKIVMPKKETSAKAAKEAAPEPVKEPDTEVALPINLKAVLECQKRFEDTLGVSVPLSEFLERATELANFELPRSRTTQPSADELFNAVLGLDKVAKTSRGHFMPQVVSANPAPTRASSAPKSDIIDILTGKTSAKSVKPARTPASVGVAAPVNVFSVSVPKGEEKRATKFMERLKTALEDSPGSLVL
ncbi:hypothetical protein K490DRAFT_67105 [Saccharata proteae CBS 121410]|uniref:Pyruvate dehydrogenase protein x component n=1 Tax=Saccharata proteae CBS 121410 TaxID=1314787 RepID=A0A9P4HQR9_9PEZI|nr:hypothetical protein K490DRAFT_67105 [Saccharata proteae CBS 121410]